VLAGRPVVAVRLQDRQALDRFGAVSHRLPCVLVGLADEPLDSPSDAAFDVLLCPGGAAPPPWTACRDELASRVAGLIAAIESSPGAAVTLTHVLRAGSGAGTAEGLVIESLAYSMLQTGDVFQRWLAAQPSRSTHRSAGPAVLLDRQDDTLTITLNRPEVRNAFNTAMRDGLVDALRLATCDDSIRHIRLAGAGPSFCSGGDLAEFGASTDPVTAHFIRSTRNAGAWLSRSSDRVTAMLHGACVGAGIELAAFARNVVADHRSSFTLPEVGMGLIPGAGGTVSIPRRIGRHRTAYFALSGTPLDPPTALAWGLIDEIA
jgi:hypothetical protein